MSTPSSPPHAGIDVIPRGIFAAGEPEKNHSDSSDKDEIPPGTFHGESSDKDEIPPGTFHVL